jgi:hypothetical protein
MYCFVSPFLEAKYCGVPLPAIIKVGCAVGRKICGTLPYKTTVMTMNGKNRNKIGFLEFYRQIKNYRSFNWNVFVLTLGQTRKYAE